MMRLANLLVSYAGLGHSLTPRADAAGETVLEGKGGIFI